MAQSGAGSRQRAVSLAALALVAVLAVSTRVATPSSVGLSSPEGRVPPVRQSPPKPTAVPFPDTPVGREMKWVVGQMSRDPVDPKLAKRFTAEFLAQVPPVGIVQILGQLRRQGPWTPVQVRQGATSGSAVLESAAGERYTMRLRLEGDRIAGLLLQAPARGQPATDWPGVDRRLAMAAQDAAVLAATVEADGSQRVVYRSGPTDPMPMASMFKLYVLAAVVEAVQGGKLTWDTKLAVTAADKSLPSGDLRTVPDGTRRTVRQIAQLMISESDNTATDLLINRLGQPALRQAVRAAGNSHAELLDPFLTTRQVFWLVQAKTPGAVRARARWRAASSTERWQLLAAAKIPATVPPIPKGSPVTWQTGLEWYATPEDVAAAQEHLQGLSTTVAGRPLKAILTKNPGLSVRGWRDVAFKGGSEPGVLTMSFHALAGPRRQILVVMGSSPVAIDEATFVAGVQDAANLLVRSPAG